MGMPAPQPVTSIAELLALPEDGMRHELLDGSHFVTTAPNFSHQRAVAEFLAALRSAAADSDAVEALTAPADIHLGPRTLVQPDVFIVPRPSDSRIAWKDVATPLLAVEILSPSTAARDRGKKRRIYLDGGVGEYWIVDVEGEVVERWQTGDERPEILEDLLTWSLPVGGGGEIDLTTLFQRIKR